MKMQRFAVAAMISLSCSAGWAAQQVDPVTGDVWNLFDSVADGVAQGYRVATVQDFRNLLANAQWDARAGSSTAYDFTKGARAVNIRGVQLSNLSNLDFGPARVAVEQMNLHGDYFANAGWLASEDGSLSLGLLEYRSRGGTACGGGRTGGCYDFLSYGHSAEIVAASDIDTVYAAGKFPSFIQADVSPGYSVPTFNPLSGFRGADGVVTAGTYMIAVPEPTTAAMTILGLAGIAAVASRSSRRQQQA